MASSMNQVIWPGAGDHGIELQLGIFYLIAMASSMNKVIRPQARDHGI